MPQNLERMSAHWRARLVEVNDLLIIAHDADEVARATMLLVAVLHDEWNQQVAVQLVRDAVDLFQSHDKTRVDVREWLREAESFLRT